MGVAAVGFVAFFLEFACFVLVEAAVSVPAMRKVGALNNKKRKLIKFIQQIIFYLFLHLFRERVF
jgi:hypothetical protein